MRTEVEAAAAALMPPARRGTRGAAPGARMNWHESGISRYARIGVILSYLSLTYTYGYTVPVSRGRAATRRRPIL